MARKKPRKCRACKKRPVWRGGDVKNPGPYCKKCYHKDVWPTKRFSGPKTPKAPPGPDLNHCPACGFEADVCVGESCPSCCFEFSDALFWWFTELPHETARPPDPIHPRESMAAAKAEQLVIEPWVSSYLARQLGGLYRWFKDYAGENLPNEELAPGKDGLPASSAPELDEVREVEQVRVVAVTDIGRGQLSVKCQVRLVVNVSLNDADGTVATMRPTWEMCLLVEPKTRAVLEHSHGWESDYLPD
jgi:hypothetical protein